MSPASTPPAVRPVAMLTHSYYEEDPRVRREAEAIVASGRPVDVYALRRPDDPALEVLDGVTVRRLGVQRHQGAGLGTYLREYVAFLVRAGFALTRAQRRRRYGLVQVHTLPDFLVFATLPLRLTGVPVILDLHEAMPEFFRARFPRRAGRLAHAALAAQERASIAAAAAVLTVNDALGDRLVDLGVARDKVTVVLNAPDLRRFDPSAHPSRPFMADGVLRIVYAGALTPTYELDVLLDAVAILAADRPGLRIALDVYGRGDAEAALAERAAVPDLAGRVAFHGRIPLEEVPAAIAAADVGVAPTRRNEFTDVSLSTKLLEYAAMGKPVIASGLPTVARYFAADTVRRYEPGDAADLARAIADLLDDPEGRAGRIARTGARVRELGWDVQAARYLRVLERVALDGAGRA
jgi:glycosyltransferase involved in cell wall biosynthesis